MRVFPKNNGGEKTGYKNKKEKNAYKAGIEAGYRKAMSKMKAGIAFAQGKKKGTQSAKRKKRRKQKRGKAKIAILMLLTVIFFSGVASAGTYNIGEGSYDIHIYCMDESTGEPVENATVELYSNDTAVGTTSTDQNGQASFTNLSAGIYRIEVSEPGFWTAKKDVQLTDTNTAVMVPMSDNPFSMSSNDDSGTWGLVAVLLIIFVAIVIIAIVYLTTMSKTTIGIFNSKGLQEASKAAGKWSHSESVDKGSKNIGETITGIFKPPKGGE